MLIEFHNNNMIFFQVWDCEMYGYNMAQSISHNQPLWCCDYSPDGRMVAAAGTGKCIFIYDTGPPPKDMELKLRIQGKYCNFWTKLDVFE